MEKENKQRIYLLFFVCYFPNFNPLNYQYLFLFYVTYDKLSWFDILDLAVAEYFCAIFWVHADQIIELFVDEVSLETLRDKGRKYHNHRTDF